MRIGPDVIQSLNENGIDISSSWAFLDTDVYSPRYTEIINQPISLEATTLDYFRFKVDTVNIEIRSGNTNTSPLLWAGISYNIPDEANESDSNTNSSIQQISTGVVLSAPNAVYGVGTISIDGCHVNLCDNPNHVGAITTYLLTSATFTLTDGVEQYIVADYNSGSPIYRLENNKTNINGSNIVLVRVCWRAGNTVHSIDYDAAGSGLANKIEAAIIQTEPYKKSLDGGLTISETSTPIERTVLMTSAIVYAGTFPHSLSAFNSSSNKLTFASVSNSVWSYTSGTTQYNNTQYNPTTGLSTLGNNNYGVVWFYRSVGNDVEVFYVLGSEEYPSIAKAQTARMRSDLSLLLRDHCILCGRIIVQKNATSGLVENVSDVSFTSSQITNHNDLQNIQGGSVATSEYYHLSAATYNKLTSGFNPAVRGLFSGTSPITYTSETGVFSHSTTGTAGTYTKIVTNATGHVTYGSVLTSADIPNLDASKITTGTFDIARIPALPADNVIITTTFSALTSGQQAGIVAGTTVLLSTDGRSFKYSGVGDKTLESSYIYISDQTPDWSIIASRPTNVSYWTNDAGYLTTTTGDARYSLISHLHTGQYLPLSGGTLSLDGDNGIRFFDSTRIYKAVGGGLIFRSNSGNVRPKFEDSTGTSWTIWDAGNLSGDQSGHYHSVDRVWTNLTSVPTASTSSSGVLTSTDWNTFNNKVSTAQLANYLPLSGGTLTGALIGTSATLISVNTSATTQTVLMLGEYQSSNFSSGNGVSLDFGLSNNGIAATPGGRISTINTNYKIDADLVFYNRKTNALVESLRLRGTDNVALFAGNISEGGTLLSAKYLGIAAASSSSNFLNKNTTFKSSGEAGVQYYDADFTSLGTVVASNTWQAPTSAWYQVLHMPLSVTGYYNELFFPVNDTNGLWWRQRRNGSYFGWFKILDSQNYNTYALPLSGGTLTGALNGTTASFLTSVTSKYSGIDTNYFSTNGNYASWGHKSAISQTNYAILQNSTGLDTFLNGGTNLYLQIANDTITQITSSSFTLFKPLNGTTMYLSSYASFNGASMPAWGANLNPIMTGGEAFLYSYKSGTGTQPSLGSNFYYDGSNLKVIGTYTNTNYPRVLLLDNNGSLLYSTSVTSPIAGATVTDLTTKFSVDKSGNASFAGTVTEAGTLLSSKYVDFSSTQTITGSKTFTSKLYISAPTTGPQFVVSGGGWVFGDITTTAASQGAVYRAQTPIAQWSWGVRDSGTRGRDGTSIPASGMWTIYREAFNGGNDRNYIYGNTTGTWIDTNVDVYGSVIAGVAGNAKISTLNINPDWARFGHYSTSLDTTATWSGFIQDSNGIIQVGSYTGKNLYLAVGGTAWLTLDNATTSVKIDKNINGTTASFTGSASFNNSTQKPWNSLTYPIAFGGECGSYTYQGIEQSFYNNCYYDGSNWRWYNTASGNRYARILQMASTGSLVYYTSLSNPTTDSIISNLTAKFSIDKSGNGYFDGNISTPAILKTDSITSYSNAGLVLYSNDTTTAIGGYALVLGKTNISISDSNYTPISINSTGFTNIDKLTTTSITITANRNLSTSDTGRIFVMGGAQTYTLTIPSTGFTAGFWCIVNGPNSCYINFPGTHYVRGVRNSTGGSNEILGSAVLSYDGIYWYFG